MVSLPRRASYFEQPSRLQSQAGPDDLQAMRWIVTRRSRARFSEPMGGRRTRFPVPHLPRSANRVYSRPVRGGTRSRLHGGDLHGHVVPRAKRGQWIGWTAGWDATYAPTGSSSRENGMSDGQGTKWPRNWPESTTARAEAPAPRRKSCFRHGSEVRRLRRRGRARAPALISEPFGVLRVPATIVGERVVHGWNPKALAELVGVRYARARAAAPAELARAARRRPGRDPARDPPDAREHLGMKAPGRDRTVRQLGFHVFRLSAAFADTREQGTSSEHVVRGERAARDGGRRGGRARYGETVRRAPRAPTSRGPAGATAR